jgi:hypothetical protein
MSRNLSKQAVKLRSQIFPSEAASVTSDMTLADTYVLFLCLARPSRLEIQW